MTQETGHTWSRVFVNEIVKREITDDEWRDLDERISTEVMFVFKQAMTEVFPNEY